MALTKSMMQLTLRRYEMSAIRPLKTDKDYELALARVDEIFDAEPDTAEGDELDVLTTLIEAYEDVHFPIEMPSPISAIKFRMEQEELSQADLNPYFGSSAKVAITEIENLFDEIVATLKLQLPKAKARK